MISKNTKKLLSEIQNHSGNKFKFPDELGFIIELSTYPGNSKIFDEIIFTGKYLNGLKSILLKESGSEESKQKIFIEFGSNLELLIRDLTSILKSQKNKLSELFNKKFLDNNSESLVNLTGMIEDLALVKNYFNDLR